MSIDIKTDEGWNELIAELRKRDAAGQIGKGSYVVANYPCCLVGHCADILYPDEKPRSYVRKVELRLDRVLGGRGMLSCEVERINDAESPAAAIDFMEAARADNRPRQED